jgi:predicted nucleic acid-binding protein
MAEPIALLDVNVLIALVDPQHVHHEPSHRWFQAHGCHGWATCPSLRTRCCGFSGIRAIPTALVDLSL